MHGEVRGDASNEAYLIYPALDKILIVIVPGPYDQLTLGEEFKKSDSYALEPMPYPYAIGPSSIDYLLKNHRDRVPEQYMNKTVKIEPREKISDMQWRERMRVAQSKEAKYYFKVDSMGNIFIHCLMIKQLTAAGKGLIEDWISPTNRKLIPHLLNINRKKLSRPNNALTLKKMKVDAGLFERYFIEKETYYSMAKDKMNKGKLPFTVKDEVGKITINSKAIAETADRLRIRCDRFLLALMYTNPKLHPSSGYTLVEPFLSSKDDLFCQRVFDGPEEKIRKDINNIRDETLKETIMNLRMTHRKYQMTYDQKPPKDAFEEFINASLRLLVFINMKTTPTGKTLYPAKNAESSKSGKVIELCGSFSRKMERSSKLGIPPGG